MTLFPDYEPIKLSVDHSTGITVDELSKSVPGQGTFSGRVSIHVPKSRPRYVLGHSTQIIPNKGLSVLRALIPRATRTVRKQQKERSANKKGSGAHGSFVSVRASTL